MKEVFEDRIKKAFESQDSDSELIPGHEERFEMRLLRMREDKKIKRFPRWPWIAAAAAVVAGVIVAITISEVKKTNDYAERVRLSDVSLEMAATEEYYNERLKLDVGQLNTTDQNIKRFLDDLKRLEGEYAMLEDQLSKNFNNQRIADAMVNNYRFRLQLMEQLQKYIEIKNKFNIQSHEEKLSS
jgi:predicted RNase H-like nuclease (RuvC/YqgF family)